MKDFFCSLAGKVILFLLVLVSLAAGILGAFVGVYLMQSDAYRLSEESFLQDYRDRIVSRRASVWAYDRFYEEMTYSADGILSMEISLEDPDGNVLYQDNTLPAWDREDLIDYTFYMLIREEEDGYRYVSDWISGADVEEEVFFSETEEEGLFRYTVRVSVPADLTGSGFEISFYRILKRAWQYRYAIWPLSGAAALLCLISFVLLMRAAGRRPHTQELAPGPLFKVPFDLLVLTCFMVIGIGLGIASETPFSAFGRLLYLCGLAFLTAALLLGLCVSFASRIKQHALWGRLLIVLAFRGMIRFCRWLGRGFMQMIVRAGRGLQKLPLIWRTAAVLAVICLLEFFGIAAFSYRPDLLFFAWMLEKVILIPVILHAALTLRTLQGAGKALAAGNLQYQVDTRGMVLDFKDYAETLNNISAGMSREIEQRLRSERMKTELITNVSHDIKTPLTSIINYADLIAREKTENDKIAGYCEVLTRQSGKLKRLIVDLIEASKASTGNLEVNPVPCDAAVFLQQTEGEYEEKLAAAGLTLVTKVPDQEIVILADSRRMWRIFDNLMNNVCKYSLRGSRVYLSLEAEQEETIIVFKNTSARQLDISPDELIERFVRGDSSRTTEGNGLGLSIARSLTELQGGSFSLQVDGDLFKAILRFPIFFITSSS